MREREQYARLGIDVGGTKTRIGFVNSAGTILSEQTLPTRPDLPYSQSVLEIADRVRTLSNKSGLPLTAVRGFGIGVPGTADSSNGIVEYCPNLPWAGAPLADSVEEFLGIRPIIAQDSWCAAWGEHLFGADRPMGSLLALTVGTGIGSGIVMGDRLFVGSMGTAGELGHTIVHSDGSPCSCGRLGCLEQYSSGTAIARTANEQLAGRYSRPLTTRDVFGLAREGDDVAIQILDQAIEELAIAISNAVGILSVERVVIGGGLGEQHELFVVPLRERVQQLGYRAWIDKGEFDLFPSRLGAAAPMIGAAFLDTLRTYPDATSQQTEDSRRRSEVFT